MCIQVILCNSVDVTEAIVERDYLVEDGTVRWVVSNGWTGEENWLREYYG